MWGCEQAADLPSAVNTRPLGPKLNFTAIHAPKMPDWSKPLGFGSVAIYKDTLAVGALGYKNGATFVYQFSGATNTWTLQQTVTPSTWNKTSPMTFGPAKMEGTTMIVSAPMDNWFDGAAFVFQRSGSKWAETQILTAAVAFYKESFGAPIALQGDTLVLGGSGSGSKSPPGNAYVYARSGSKWAERQKLTCPSKTCGGESYFGSQLSLSGDTLLVGAVGERSVGPYSGAAYVFTRQKTAWVLQQQLLPTDIKTQSNFGWGATLEGDTAVVGANYSGQLGLPFPSAYVFNRTGTKWTQSAKLTSANQPRGGGFGSVVLLRGDTLLVGAPGDSTLQPRAGAVYLFERSGKAWTQKAKLLPPTSIYQGFFGGSLAYDGKTLAIGSSEVVYVYRGSLVLPDAGAPDLGPEMSLPSPDISPDQVASDLAQPDSAPVLDGGEEGCSCTVDRPGQAAPPMLLILLVSLIVRLRLHRELLALLALASCAGGCVEAPAEDMSSRTVARSVGVGPKLTAIAAPKIPGNTQPLGFGSAYVHKDWLLVGAYDYMDGSAFVYQRSGTAWKKQQMLQSSKGTRYVPRGFGYGVVQGNHMIISAARDGVKVGSAYYFHYSGSKWVEKQILYAKDWASNMFFGAPVVMQGNTLVLGATGIVNTHYGQKPGAAYVFALSGTTWKQQQKLVCPSSTCSGGAHFGMDLALSGNTLLVGSYSEKAVGSLATGAAYIYVRAGTTWTLQQKLAPKGLAQYDYFGAAGALEGDTAVVGAEGDNTRGQSAGAAYIFERSGTSWTQAAKLAPNDLKPDDWFGGEVLLRGDVLLIGAYEDSTRGPKAGAVHVYHRSGKAWTRQLKLLPPKGTKAFGSSISLDGKTLAIGAKEEVFVGPWSFKLVDAGPPDLGPDAGISDGWPDQFHLDANLSPYLDAALPDQRSADAAPPDQRWADAAQPDSTLTGSGEQGGCSCSLGQPADRPHILLLLLLLIPCLLTKIRQTSPS